LPFPLFLIVATQAMAAENALEGGGYFLAYFAGMSGMMLLTILLSVFAKNILMKSTLKIQLRILHQPACSSHFRRRQGRR
jgi:cytochrome c-type biogenesis protein